MKLFEAKVLSASTSINSIYESDSFDLESNIIETIDYLVEHAQDWAETKTAMYEDIYAANGNRQIITEAVGDVIETFKDWIKKAIEYIKKQVSKFISKLNEWVGDNTYIRKNAKLISNIYDFEVKGAYTYTIPPMIDLTSIEKIYTQVDTLASNLILDANSTKEMIKVFKGQNIEDMNERELNSIRGKLVKKSSITKEAFAASLHSYFRNGETEPGNIKVTKELVDSIQKIYQKDGGYAPTIKKLNAQVKSVEDMYDKTTDAFERLKKRVETIVGDDEEKDNLYIVAMAYINKMSNYVNEINSAIMLYLSAELDAIREMAVLNNKIAARIISVQKKEVKL